MNDRGVEHCSSFAHESRAVMFTRGARVGLDVEMNTASVLSFGSFPCPCTPPALVDFVSHFLRAHGCPLTAETLTAERNNP